MCSTRHWPPEVDAGSCDDVAVRQAVAGIVVRQKNGCIHIGAPETWGIAFSRECLGLAGTTAGPSASA